MRLPNPFVALPLVIVILLAAAVLVGPYIGMVLPGIVSWIFILAILVSILVLYVDQKFTIFTIPLMIVGIVTVVVLLGPIVGLVIPVISGFYTALVLLLLILEVVNLLFGQV